MTAVASNAERRSTDKPYNGNRWTIDVEREQARTIAGRSPMLSREEAARWQPRCLGSSRQTGGFASSPFGEFAFEIARISAISQRKLGCYTRREGVNEPSVTTAALDAARRV